MFLTPETMKLLRSTENKITKDKNGVVLVHFNIVNNDDQQDSRVNKPFCTLLELSPTNNTFLKQLKSKF